MFRIFVVVLFACFVTAAVAQEDWRNGQPSWLAQSGPHPGQVPGPAAIQSLPNQAQYSNAGNYDLPLQSVPNHQQQQQQQQQPHVTRQTQIPLPFKITPANQDKLSSVELVYSMDQGKSWYHYQHLPPTETQFDFNVPEDGEYWFVFRAVHKTGEVKPFGAMPAARILVDTVPPKLTLDVRRSSSGEVTIEWTVEDLALKNTPPTISLSYDSNATWMTLAVDRKNVKRDGNRETGHVAFWPLHDAEAVEIRCELEDLAENREIQTKRLVLKPSLHGNATETAMTSLASVEPTVVQQVPDLTITPPKPIVMNTSYSLHDSHAVPSVVTPDNTFNDLLQTMGGTAPLPVSADVTQRYAENPGQTTAQRTPGSPPMVGPNGSDAATIPTETLPFPGKITIVSDGLLRTDFNAQRCIIVRWMSGGTPFADGKVDLYRSETKYGPWRPISVDLKNTGEHYWLVTAADLMPFYLRVDLRSLQGLYTDFTLQPISLPLNLNDPASPPATQQDTPASPEPNGSEETSVSRQYRNAAQPLMTDIAAG